MMSRIALFLIILTLPGSGRSQDTPVGQPDSSASQHMEVESLWEVSIRPYFFLSGISGSVTSEPLTIPINSTFGELLDNIKFGGFVSVIVEKGLWGAFVDVQYINLKGEATGQLGSTLALENIIVEGDITFRPLGSRTLRFLAGVRFYNVDQTLTLGNQPPITATTLVADPVIGAMGIWTIGRTWEFQLRGDIGGFGVSSEFTSQLSVIFIWDASDLVRIPFGYRVLLYQIKTGDVWMNTTMGGLVLGVDFAL
jgi:hypothetical protein